MLTTPADKWFSLCVRERAAWVCEYCGKQYERGAQGIHCSHYFGRGYWSVRFEPINAFAHCFFCHQKMESNPDMFHAWVEKRLGAVRLDLLREKAYNLTLAKEIRRTKGKGEIAKHYENEHARMMVVRACGELGRIEFI